MPMPAVPVSYRPETPANAEELTQAQTMATRIDFFIT